MTIADWVSGISHHLLSFSLLLTLLIVIVTGLSSWLLQVLGKRYLEAVRGKFSRIGYVRTHILIGGLLVGLLGYWFAEAAELAFETTGARSLDVQIANAVHEGASRMSIALFGAITELGGLGAQIALGLIVGLVLLVKRQRVLLTAWLVGIGGGTSLNFLLKSGFRRQRPSFDDPFLVEKLYSFPSGHAMGSVVLYGLLTYFAFVLAPPRYRLLCTTLALILGTLIGISRLVLGVHYFSDVLAGWVMGALWVTIVVTCSQLYRTWWTATRGTSEKNSATLPG